jgi:hypothetical protein
VGRWLGRLDPRYDGFVVSRYTQPVYYAGMDYFDTDHTRDLFVDLKKRGTEFKYIILDGDETGTWYRQYVTDNNWVCIRSEQERNIRIFLNPEYPIPGKSPMITGSRTSQEQHGSRIPEGPG